MQAAKERQQDLKAGQLGLFDSVATEGAGGPAVETLPEVEPWPEKEKLRHEKAVLDFYMSSHPLATHEKELLRFCSHKVSELPTVQPGQEITLGGMLTQLRLMNVKKSRNGNTRYLRCKIEDFSGAAECVMWPDDYIKYKDEVREDRVCFVRGAIDERSARQEPIVILTQILSVEQMQRQACGEIWIRLQLGQHPPYLIDTLASILKRSPGTCPVWLCVTDGAGKKASLRLNRGFGINPLAFLPGEIEDLLGPGSVKLVATSNGRR